MSNNDNSDRVDGAAPTASIDTLMKRQLRNLELGLRVAVPARVVSYDPATQKVVARSEYLRVRALGDEELPELPDVFNRIPVAWPRGMAGQAWQAFPLSPNDTGYVVFMDRCLSQWLLTGNPVAPVDPVSGRTHDLADGVFVPGLHTDTDLITPTAPADAHVVQGPLVRLGATTAAEAEFAVKGTQLVNFINGMLAAAAAATVPNDGGAAAITAMQTYSAANIATLLSTRVQVGG